MDRDLDKKLKRRVIPASTEKMAFYREELIIFVEHIVGADLGMCFISDKSSPGFFAPNLLKGLDAQENKEWVEEISDKLKERYGPDFPFDPKESFPLLLKRMREASTKAKNQDSEQP